MPVNYEELPGSPSFEMDRKGGQGKRTVKINWNDLLAFLEELFPSPATGYLYGAVFPGLPWLVATRVAVQPFVDSTARADVADWTAWHEFAEVSVDYTVPGDDQEQQTGGDGTGPGGNAGSSAGQEVTFLSHKVTSGGEFMTWPADAIEWDEPAWEPGDTQDDAEPIETLIMEAMNAIQETVKTLAFPVLRNQHLLARIDNEIIYIHGMVTNRDRSITLKITRGEEKTAPAGHIDGSPILISNLRVPQKQAHAVGDEVACAVTIPLVEHTIEWNYVAFPPWISIRQLMGKVNYTDFAGSPMETCLFMGAECSRDVTSSGIKCWKMSYKFSEKNMNSLNPLVPQGWNFFLRPTGENAGTFQRLRKKINITRGGAPPATTLSIDLPAAQNYVMVANTNDFPQTGQFLIQIDNEIIAVSALVGIDTWGVLRGIQGTTIAAHFGGALVTQVSGGVYDVADMSYLFINGF